MNARFHFTSGFVPPSQKQWHDALDDLAELLSRDRYTLNEIAECMSISRGSACVLLCTLFSLYGETVQ